MALVLIFDTEFLWPLFIDSFYFSLFNMQVDLEWSDYLESCYLLLDRLVFSKFFII